MIRATIASNCSRGMLGSNSAPGAPRRAAGRGSGPASRSRTSRIASRARSWRRLVLVDVGVGEDRDRVLEVVEGDDHVGEHQRHVGQPERVGVGSGSALDGAHAVVAEEADRAARERGRLRRRRLAVARDLGRRERVGVAAVGERPAQHAARLVADERPAPDALALLGRLEQERRARSRAASGTRETGVSQSSMNVSQTGTRLCVALSDAGQGAPPRRRRG